MDEGRDGVIEAIGFGMSGAMGFFASLGLPGPLAGHN